MKEWIAILRISLQFFTILPLAKTVQWTEKRTARSLFVLPWIGMLLGLMFYSFLQLLQSSPITTIVDSILVLLLPLVLTGGLHLDGWMDMFIDEIVDENTDKAWFKIDKDEFEELSAENNVMGIPSLLVYKNGEKIAHLH